LVTTRVAGCSVLVRDEVEGLLAPPQDAAALAHAFQRLATDPALVARLGAAARARIEEAFTERHVMDAVKRIYVRLFGGVPAIGTAL
jgi:glycosyltransferase involved in cell wall biosynthesis